MDLIDIKFYLMEKLRFHIWYLYFWYVLVCFSGIILLINGTSFSIVFVGCMIDTAIPTIIYFAFKYRKHG